MNVFLDVWRRLKGLKKRNSRQKVSLKVSILLVTFLDKFSWSGQTEKIWVKKWKELRDSSNSLRIRQWTKVCQQCIGDLALHRCLDYPDSILSVISDNHSELPSSSVGLVVLTCYPLSARSGIWQLCTLRIQLYI